MQGNVTRAAPAPGAGRLEGLDLARYVALVGMVYVNFRLAMQPAAAHPTWLGHAFELLEGKAAATFVVLAGIGLTLATRGLDCPAGWTIRRAGFLLAVGIVNLAIFPADIIHYYGVYFLLAVPLLRARAAGLVLALFAVACVSTWALVRFDYGRGWDWSSLDYADFWTPAGFVRHLLFNGFHPVLPWMSLFVCGMLLGRLPLHRPAVQWRLVWTGLAGFLLAHACAAATRGGPWQALCGTAPMPPGPVYLLTGIGGAMIVIGLSLVAGGRWPGAFWTVFTPAGRMTLTLYLAHIVVGMGILEALGALDGSRTLPEVAAAASAFLAAGTFLAWLWSRRWRHGPVEAVMRRLTARPARVGEGRERFP